MADPLSTLGAAAAVLQLVQVCVSTSKVAKRLYNSFREAPDELHCILRKLTLLEIRIKQIQDLGIEESDIDMNDLFPELYRTFLLGELESNRLSLTKMSSLLSHCEGDDGLTMRIRWATLDKKRAMNILREIAETERSLDMSINILNTRILTLNYTSLGALRAGQNALLPALDACSKDMKSSIDVANRVLLQAETFENFRQEYNSEVVLQKYSFDLIQKMHTLQMAQLEELKVDLGLSKKKNRTSKLSSNLDTIFPKDPSSSQPLEIHSDKNRVKQTTSAKQAVTSDHRVYKFSEYASNPVVATYEAWRSGDELRYLTHIQDQCNATSKSRSRFSRTLTIRSRKYNRKIQMALVMALQIFGPQILRLEFNIQQFARTWASLPWIDCRITIINVRPFDWPVFKAVMYRDLPSIRRLIENGEASVNDINEHGWSILEINLLFGRGKDIYEIAQYLLVQAGANPNLGTGNLFKFAMNCGCLDTSRLLLASGVDLTQLEHPALCLSNPCNSGEIIEEQIAMLYSLGFTDLGPYDDLFHAAIVSGSIAAIVLAVKHYRQDPNHVLMNTIRQYQTPIGLACSEGNFRVCQALLELGVDLHRRFLRVRQWEKIHTYWHSSYHIIEEKRVNDFDLGEYNSFYGYETAFSSIKYHVGRSGFNALHWLLLQGMNTRSEVQRPTQKSSIWAGLLPHPKFKFQRQEGVYLHVLLHGADPFEDVYLESYDRFPAPSNSEPPLPTALAIPAILIPHAWDHYRESQHHVHPYILHRLDKMSKDQFPSYELEYTATGWIQMKHHFYKSDYPLEIKSDQFEKITLFYNTISTEQGRHQMRSFPLTRALYNALILAGYRATIDQDGDIWFEDEDGERYMDAREYQPKEAEDDGVVANCPICQDPAKYGLSHIWEEAEAGKILVQEELRKYYKTRQREI